MPQEESLQYELRLQHGAMRLLRPRVSQNQTAADTDALNFSIHAQMVCHARQFWPDSLFTRSTGRIALALVD